MGGDHGRHDHRGVDFQQKVWSMMGGPYCRPVHWRRNTAIAMFGIFLVYIPISMKSATPPSSRYTTPLRRNTAIAMFGIFLVYIPISMKSATPPSSRYTTSLPKP